MTTNLSSYIYNQSNLALTGGGTYVNINVSAGETISSITFANSANGLNDTFEIDNVNTTPEPGTWGMLLIAGAALGARFRKTRRSAA